MTSFRKSSPYCAFCPHCCNGPFMSFIALSVKTTWVWEFLPFWKCERTKQNCCPLDHKRDEQCGIISRRAFCCKCFQIKQNKKSFFISWFWRVYNLMRCSCCFFLWEKKIPFLSANTIFHQNTFQHTRKFSIGLHKMPPFIYMALIMPYTHSLVCVKENVEFTATRTMILDGFMAIVKCHDQNFLTTLLKWIFYMLLSDIVRFRFLLRKVYSKVPCCGCWVLRLKFSIIIIVIANAPPLFMKKHFIQDYCKSLFDDVIFFLSKSNMLLILLTLLFATKIVFLFLIDEIIFFSLKRDYYTH